MKRIGIVFAILTLALCLTTIVSGCEVPPVNPSITLSPPQGFAMTTISGADFSKTSIVTVTYDGVVQPTIPAQVKTDSSGAFTVIISIPDELAVGVHTIRANDSYGYSASATFTVVDMKGSQGLQGPQGVAGQNGKEGLNGAAGTNGLDFNGTGNIFLYNGTNGQSGQNFNATGNTFVYNGTNGLNGQNGLNGIDGTNGINGVNGKDGTNGVQGVSGTQGLQGPSGEVVYVDPPPTPKANLDSFIAEMVIVLVAFTVAMLLAYRKSMG